MAKYQNISNNTRYLIIDNHNKELSVKEISEFLNLKLSTVRSIIKKYLNTGKVEKDKKGGNNHVKVTDEISLGIINYVDNNASASLSKIAQYIFREFQINLNVSTVNKVLKKFHYTLKEVLLVPERRISQENITQQKEYSRSFLQLLANTEDSKIIFLDEVGFNVSMRTKRGRAQKGITPHVVVPVLKSRNISICCAMTKYKILYKEINTSPFNRQSFLGYIQNIINFLSAQGLRNCVFIMDNVRFHKCNEVLEKIRSTENSYIFLPPYSPDLNPIENLFSKWKNFVKRSNSQNETQLFENIENGMNSITSEDCGGYFRNMLSHINSLINL